MCRLGIGRGAHASAATGVRERARAKTAAFIVLMCSLYKVYRVNLAVQELVARAVIVINETLDRSRARSDVSIYASKA